jgi:hypothetical protein
VASVALAAASIVSAAAASGSVTERRLMPRP